jgi:hypothetical protein
MKDVLPHLLEETYMCFCITVQWHIDLSQAVMLPYPLVCLDYIFYLFLQKKRWLKSNYIRAAVEVEVALKIVLLAFMLCNF